MANAKRRTKPGFVKIPGNWNEMTKAQKRAASEEIARALQRQLGVKAK